MTSRILLLLAVVGPLLSCGPGTKKKIEHAGDGIVTCVKLDAPELLKLTAEMLAAAAASVLRVGGIDWKALVAKAKAAGIELGGCAFAAIYNAFDKQGADVVERGVAATPLPRRQALDELRAELGAGGWQLADGTVVR